MYRDEEVARLHARVNEIEASLKNIKSAKSDSPRNKRDWVLPIVALCVAVIGILFTVGVVNTLPDAVALDRAQRRTAMFDYCFPKAIYDKDIGTTTHLVGHRVSDNVYVDLVWVQGNAEAIVETSKKLNCPLMAK